MSRNPIKEEGAHFRQRTPRTQTQLLLQQKSVPSNEGENCVSLPRVRIFTENRKNQGKVNILFDREFFISPPGRNQAKNRCQSEDARLACSLVSSIMR